MRDIEFRGKRVDNGEWVYGYYIHMTNGKKETNRIYTGWADTDVDDWFGEWHEVSPETVGQSTGLRDKNGKEIYEGDVIRWWGYEVSNGKQIRPERIITITDFIKDSHKIICITEGTGQSVEIIGNIHEGETE